MTFKPNKKGLEAVFAEMAAKLSKVDANIRAEHTGRPAAEVEPLAEAAFAKAGVHLTGSLHDYAVSVERDESFQLHLR